MHGTLRAPARHIAGAATAPRPTPCICGSTTSATSSSNVGGGGGGIQVVGTVCRGLSVADAAAPSAAPGAPSSGRTRQYTRIAGGSRSVVATAAVEVLGPVAGMSPSAVQVGPCTPAGSHPHAPCTHTGPRPRAPCKYTW
eukprot:361539-Chlamydomonas_euryale.AAC.6